MWTLADKQFDRLSPIVSPNNPINAYPGNNSIVITDYAENLARAT